MDIVVSKKYKTFKCLPIFFKNLHGILNLNIPSVVPKRKVIQGGMPKPQLRNLDSKEVGSSL